MSPDTSAGEAPPEPQGFAVKDCALLTAAIGKRVFTHRELRDTIAAVDTGSIYHHFWAGMLQAHFEEREYNNDFAVWMHDAMRDAVLAERIAVLDPTDHPDMSTLQQELVELIDERLEEAEHLNWVRATRPFEFMRAKIVVFDTQRRLTDPAELARALPAFTLSSVFYHFIDARRRLENSTDDFRAWFGGLAGDYGEICDALAAIDPYFVSLEELRVQLTTLFTKHLGANAA